MLYKGNCHCGKVAFEVEGELTAAVACNCSICSRTGRRSVSLNKLVAALLEELRADPDLQARVERRALDIA